MSKETQTHYFVRGRYGSKLCNVSTERQRQRETDRDKDRGTERQINTGTETERDKLR